MIGVTHVALTTLGTVLMIGLGFLARPGKATALWSIAFVAAMVTSYGWVIAAELDLEPVRLASTGLILSAPAFIWSGLRADRGARSRWEVSTVFGVAAALVLVLSGQHSSYSLVFRIVFAAAAVFATLSIIELARRHLRDGGATLPLMVTSILLVQLAALSLIAVFVIPGMGIGDLDILREVNLLGMLVYVICALVTLLLLARGDAPPAATATSPAHHAFSTSATERLARAQHAGERTWALLEIRLDDTYDLHAAGGDRIFQEIVERFEECVRTTFPADADIAARGDGRVAVLITRPEAVVRQILRRLLEAISASEAARPLAVHLSASIGWALAADADYDLEALQHAAVAAAERAVAAGGDRWERAVDDDA